MDQSARGNAGRGRYLSDIVYEQGKGRELEVRTAAECRAEEELDDIREPTEGCGGGGQVGWVERGGS